MRPTVLTIGSAVVILLLLGSEACVPSMECANTIVADLPAPDGQHHAVIFDRNCGATTRVRTEVSVLARGERPADSGNAFSTDQEFGPGLAPRLGQPLLVHWLDAQTLEIRYDGRARTVLAAPRQDAVRVHYVAAGANKPAT